MNHRIFRGVRVTTAQGMRAASVHVRDGIVIAISDYTDVPRETVPEEIGKNVLMPGLIVAAPQSAISDGGRFAAAAGITTLLISKPPPHDDLDVDVFPWAEANHAVSPKWAMQLPITWTSMRQNNAPIENIVETLCTAPATAAGIDTHKGRLDLGMDADFTIWRPEYTINGSHPPLYGEPQQTVVRGRTIFRK